MSWILGYSGFNVSSVKEKFKVLNLKPDGFYERENFFIAYGGNNKTILTNSNIKPVASNSPLWIVAGTGIKRADGNYKILTKREWSDLIENDHAGFNNIEGYFVIVKWDGGKLNFYSDQLGLRDINIVKDKKGFYFGTRLDLLSKISGAKLNYKLYCSRWFLINQISTGSLLNNSIRIVSGSTAEIKNGNLSVTKKLWNFNPQSFNSNMKENFSYFYDKLQKIASIHSEMHEGLSLSLSGGLDSRFLFSLLLNKESIEFDTHTFGNKNHPDNVIASKICNDFNIQHFQLNYNFAANEIYDLMSGYINNTNFTNPVSSILLLGNYTNPSIKNKVLIDGGFGEIWRRGFLRKFSLYGKKLITEGNTPKIVPYLSVNRGNIFNEDILPGIKENIEEQIVSQLESMPVIDELGFDNWLDLFSIRTRLVNFYGPEQSYADSMLTTVMPFAQHSLLSELINIPVKFRRNKYLIKYYFNSVNPGLKNYPLAKGNSTVSFKLNPVASAVMLKLKNKFGSTYKDTGRVKFIVQLKDFIYDRINSKNFNKAGFYNEKYIVKIIEDFYEGKVENINIIDWWLAFDIFFNNFENNSLY